jgi:hypothetical protein
MTLVMVMSLMSSTLHAVEAKYAATARRARAMHVAEESKEMRAPRPDAPTSGVVSPFDATILADIAACCCNLTNITVACCSQINGIIGSLTDPGICDATLWSTVAGIQDTQQSVIGWLKTIMIELRGLCQPVIP